MVLKTVNHSYSYPAKNICTVFFPTEKIKESGEDNIVVETVRNDVGFVVRASVFEKVIEKSVSVKDTDNKSDILCLLLYSVLSSLTGFYPPWGILYGVRPARLMHSLSAKIGESSAERKFINDYSVQEKKTKLTLDVMYSENDIIALSRENSFSLYVSIPFCPTRCSYCSFVSHSIEKTHKLLEPYVELLCTELKRIGEIAKSFSLRLETIYFGGGTPTVLSPKQLSVIFSEIEKDFDLSHLREYTVEAGRPDTVTAEKLDALKSFGIGRISINPQTFNDKVLEAIGRKHTSQMTLDAFFLARSHGFDNINMDLIAGLPLDALPSFKNSVDTAVSLSAESVTVHTLAMKSASYLVTQENPFDFSDRLITSDMVDYSNEKLREHQYHPYYMYRQSKSRGNLENVGWSKPGRDCLYNVFMMDETHSVFAAGAGAVTRLKNQQTSHIERIYNYKYPYEYIKDFDEILKRKQGIIDFLNK
ncbi:MAG: coproporphyrinogen dehydrogenase HemZ [Clostridiales bacterium]|nr:coproporphyrinogen dehydrogenase HemZ [Clostridiales bacterium]